MKGSCLCGACVFELKGRISAVGKCYCSKCQKVSGTGSNAVHWAKPENLEWISGEKNSNSYTTESGWGSTFCRDCGSPLPMMPKDKSMWFVPAGLMDGQTDVNVRGHIWVSNKPSWDEIGDNAPQFEENTK